MNKFLNNYYGDTVLEQTYIKVGFQNRLKRVYNNELFKITADIDAVVKKIEETVAKNEGCDTYIAPVTYVIANGAKENVAYIMGLVSDFDNYKGEMIKNMSEEEAEKCRIEMINTLQTLKLKPSIIVKSGNGLQAHWCLNEPLKVENNVTVIENVQKALAALPSEFKGDPAVAVLGHTVRLPGTKNCKDPDNIKDCEIVHIDKTAVYDLGTFMCELNVVDVPEQVAENPYSGSLMEAYQKLGANFDQVRLAGLECEFLKSMARNSDKQTEILWYHLCNNFVHLGEHGRMLFHTISQRYPGYSYEETEQLFQTTLEKAKNQGFLPTSCRRIAEDGFVCPKECPQKTPAGMMFSLIKSNIATEEEKDEPVTIETAINRLKPSPNTISNVKALEKFISEEINPLPDSLLVKGYYLSMVVDKLDLRQAGSFNRFKKLLIDTTYGKTGNIQVDIAEGLLQEVPLKYICGDIFRYKGGIWSIYSDYIDGVIIEKLGANYGDPIKKGIIAYIRGKAFLSVKDVNQHTKENILCLKNGMLKIHSDGRREILPHDPKYYALNQLSIEYDELARCPKFLTFIDQCFCVMSDTDRETTKEALRNWFGYSLLPGNPYHRLAMLIGESRAGKGVLLRIYSELLGKENISNIELPNLHIPINAIQLMDKIANVAPEMGENDTFNLAFMKSATAEDGISGRGHYEKTQSFQNQAKLMGQANHLPKIFEKGDSFDVRLLAFPFDTQVAEEDRNVDLFDELKLELPGILNWAIEGRTRLLQRGRFLESEPMLAKKRQINENSNLVIQWFNAIKMDLKKDCDYETFKSLHTSFKDFCDEEGVKKVPLRKTFKENLKCLPGVRIEQLSKPNQECVFFDREKLGIEVAQLETTDVKSAASFDLTDEFVFLEDSENTTGDQTPQTDISDQLGTKEQSEIDLRVINLLENKHSDVRAFN